MLACQDRNVPNWIGKSTSGIMQKTHKNSVVNELNSKPPIEFYTTHFRILSGWIGALLYWDWWFTRFTKQGVVIPSVEPWRAPHVATGPQFWRDSVAIFSPCSCRGSGTVMTAYKRLRFPLLSWGRAQIKTATQQHIKPTMMCDKVSYDKSECCGTWGHFQERTSRTMSSKTQR